MGNRSASSIVTAAVAVCAGVMAWLVLAPSEGRPATPTQQLTLDIAGDAFAALPQQVDADAAKVALGRQLFHEVRLSGDGTVSCAHCHGLDTGGVDRLAQSRGVGGQLSDLNAPTVYNSGFNFRQFWDGRAETLEDQVEGPLLHPKEMAGSWEQVLRMLGKDSSYLAQFRQSYGGVTRAAVKDAIATFERSLVTPNARFDRYLRGDAQALSATEKAGFQLFKEMGCASCHQGVNLGGNMYQKLGVIEDFYTRRGPARPADEGRFKLTRSEADLHVFKVPTLRNIVLTAPYLHDGSAATLDEAVYIMARYQLGRGASAQEVGLLLAFLGSLTGEYQGRPLR